MTSFEHMMKSTLVKLNTKKKLCLDFSNFGTSYFWRIVFYLAYHTSKCYATKFTVLKNLKICYSRSPSLAIEEMKSENKIKERRKLLGCFLSWVRVMIHSMIHDTFLVRILIITL